VLCQDIEEPSQNHLPPLHKRSTVAAAFRMRGGSFKIVHDRKQILNQGLIGETNRFILFSIDSLFKIFQLCDLAKVPVVVLVGLFLFCLKLFAQFRQFD